MMLTKSSFIFPASSIPETVKKAMFAIAIVGLVSLSNQNAQSADSPNNDSLGEALAAVCTVEANGEGHESAVKAMKVINAASIDQVPEILVGMDGANKLSANWLRSAVVSIVGRSDKLPREEITAYFRDTGHSHLGRLLAFELLTDGDEELASKWIPGLIDDPSLPLREKAVAALIKSAESNEDPIQKIGGLTVALKKARNVSQVQEIAKLLAANDVSIDLQRQLGFLNAWNVVSSFDNKDEAGFEVAYGPEKDLAKIDTGATYDDAIEAAKWEARSTTNSTGVMDLNKVVGNVKGATAYAYTTFNASEARSAEFRIGTPNATKIWLNGKLVMANQIYHNSNSIDKFTGVGELKEGENQILIKVCQNEQKESWAQDWQFQLRICDESGLAIKPAVPARN